LEEKEVKFIDIDPVEMENKLKNIGAKKVFDKIYRRRVFDYPDLRLNKNSSWIRVRDGGDKVTLAFKHRLGAKGSDGKFNDRGMEEVEVIVNDFDKTTKILEKIGLKEKFYEENRRIRYVKDGVEFDIDFWPGIEPYLEVEAETWEEVDKAIEDLGLDPKDKKIFSTYQVYKLNGINEDDYKIITFEKMVKK